MSTLAVNNVTEVGGAPVVTGGVLDSGSLPTGTVLQVVSNNLNVSTTTTSTSFVDTPLTTSITPSSTSSKILVIANIQQIVCPDTAAFIQVRLFRGDTSGTAFDAYAQFRPAANYANASAPAGLSYLDSPSSTSSVTYTVGVKSSNSSYSVICSGLATITLIEVAG